MSVGFVLIYRPHPVLCFLLRKWLTDKHNALSHSLCNIIRNTFGFNLCSTKFSIEAPLNPNILLWDESHKDNFNKSSRLLAACSNSWERRICLILLSFIFYSMKFTLKTLWIAKVLESHRFDKSSEIQRLTSWILILCVTSISGFSSFYL